MKAQIPMAITVLRLILVPVVLFLLEFPDDHLRIMAAIGFAIAAISDWADGYLARKWDVVSTWGKLLDPIADKVLVTSVLVLLTAQGVFSPYVVIIIIARDTLVGGVRSMAASEGIIIDAGTMGKWKTAIQMMALPLCMLPGSVAGVPSTQWGAWGLWFSVALSLWSGAEYTIGFFQKRTR